MPDGVLSPITARHEPACTKGVSYKGRAAFNQVLWEHDHHLGNVGVPIEYGDAAAQQRVPADFEKLFGNRAAEPLSSARSHHDHADGHRLPLRRRAWATPRVAVGLVCLYGRSFDCRRRGLTSMTAKNHPARRGL